MKAIAILPLALAGCTLAKLEAEVPELCVTRAGLEVISTGGERATVRTTIADLATLGDVLEPQDEVTLVRFTARAASGVESLGFVRQARVVVAVADPSSPLPELVVFECSADCITAEGAFAAAPATDANLAAYVRAPELAFELALEGELPAQTWTFDATVCLRATAQRSYRP